MTVSVYVALALSVLAAVLAPRLVTRLAPETAVRTIGWTVGLSALARFANRHRRLHHHLSDPGDLLRRPRPAGSPGAPGTGPRGRRWPR